MKTVAKCTSELGRRMARGYLRYIIDMHKKGLCWQGDWKDSDMKVRSDGREFTITKVPEYNISKDGMKEDFKKFFEILFPYYMHESEETNSDSGKIEKKKVLPYYFLQFQQDCAEVPHPQRESVKLENFQKFLGSHPAFMSPLAMTTFIGDLFISCDNLRHHNAEFLPLQDKTAKMVDWIDHAKNLCKPFRDIYYLVTSAAYEPGYWYFLNFLRNFIQHMRMDKPDQDIAVSGIMIGYHLEIYVPPFILFVLNNCDMNSLFLSSSWNRFEESQ
ncbi:uncharacterized protein [Setaria viridis]|uniref:uncharacterized protein n=1 Tax=Setaria viridis TaxID=4556 RepID=UPI003B3AA71A